MRVLFVAISAVILFFPAFWLFSQAVGDDWGAGMAAVFMYLWYPYFALKFLGRNDAKDLDDMGAALAKGELEVTDYKVSAYIEIEESEDEGLYFLLSVEPGKTLCLTGQYLYDVVERGNFPSTKIRLFWNNREGFTYGVEGVGNRLLPLRTMPPFTQSQWDAPELPADREVVESAIEDVADKIESYRQ